MSIGKFDYYAPNTLDEAVQLLEKYGSKAKVMAGGTDLMVKMRLKAINPEVIISLKNIPDLDTITVDPQKGLTFGATALLADVANHKDVKNFFPAVAAAANETANVQVRNMGTVVGNLCNASPSADNAPTLLVMDATVHIFGLKGKRDLPLNDFFKGPGITALEPNEIVTAVSVPMPPAHTGVVYQSFSGRGKLDCSTVGIGVFVTLDGDICKTSRIAVGACAPVPMRTPDTEDLLTGALVNNELISEAGRKAAEETQPIDDVRASATYRLQVVEVLTKRSIIESVKMAQKQ